MSSARPARLSWARPTSGFQNLGGCAGHGPGSRPSVTPLPRQSAILNDLLGILAAALVIVIVGTGLALLAPKQASKYTPTTPKKATYVVAVRSTT